MTAWAINSCAGGGQLVRFTPGVDVGAGRQFVHVWNQVDVVDGKPVMVSYRQELLPNKKGEYVMYLVPGDVQFYVAGTKEQLLKRYPAGRYVKRLKSLAAADSLKAGKALLDAEIARRVVEKPAFAVDPNKCRPIDLRKFVNRRFMDATAGWTRARSSRSKTLRGASPAATACRWTSSATTRTATATAS